MAGLAQPLLVGLTDVDPQQRLADEAAAPQVGFVHVGHRVGKGQRRLVVLADRVQRIGEQAHHQALVVLRRVLGDRQRMGPVVPAVHVGDLQFGLEDGGFEGHEGVGRRCDGGVWHSAARLPWTVHFQEG
jgi:hypothetical protein